MPKEKQPRRRIGITTQQPTVETHDYIEQFSQSCEISKECGSQTHTEMIDTATDILSFLPDVVETLRRKIKSLQEKIRGREKKNCSMKGIIRTLKKKGHLIEKLHEFLNQQTGTQVELVCNLLNNSVSSKGNRSVMSTLMPLPHKSLISRWAETVNCDPGDVSDVFRYFEFNHQARTEFKNSSLIIDSMAIRKQVVWDQETKRYTGFADFGGEVDQSKEVKEASEALVFMLVSI